VPFWVDAFLLLFEPFRGSFHDRDFLLELANLMSCRSNFGRFLGTVPGVASVIDIVLTQPGMQPDLVDAEIRVGLLDLLAFADERDRGLTKLWGVRAGHRR